MPVSLLVTNDVADVLQAGDFHSSPDFLSDSIAAHSSLNFVALEEFRSIRRRDDDIPTAYHRVFVLKGCLQIGTGKDASVILRECVLKIFAKDEEEKHALKKEWAAEKAFYMDERRKPLWGEEVPNFYGHFSGTYKPQSKVNPTFILDAECILLEYVPGGDLFKNYPGKYDLSEQDDFIRCAIFVRSCAG